MADETTKDDKPKTKATLIKHPHPVAEVSEQKEKKVVVIKKTVKPKIVKVIKKDVTAVSSSQVQKTPIERENKKDELPTKKVKAVANPVSTEKKTTPKAENASKKSVAVAENAKVVTTASNEVAKSTKSPKTIETSNKADHSKKEEQSLPSTVEVKGSGETSIPANSTRNYADNIKSSIAFNQQRKESRERRQNEDVPAQSTRHFRAKKVTPGVEGGASPSGYGSNNYASNNTGSYNQGGERPSGTGYQGQNPRPNNGTGFRPSGTGTGYQGQNYRPSGPGGYRPGGPTGSSGGYRPGGPGGSPGGYRPGGSGGSPGGYRPGGPGGSSGGYRPGGPGGSSGGPNTGRRPYTPGGAGRPGFGSGGPGGRKDSQSSPPPTNSREEGKKHHNKRFFKSKKKEFPVGGSEAEKNFQMSKKKDNLKVSSIPKFVDILEVISVAELARKMNLKASDLIGKLFSMGVMATINQQIDSDTATILADEYGCQVNVVSLYDETIIEKEADIAENLKSRPPIITVMGHVDHGKTKLLDTIRDENVVAGEAGGITQHIGAYKISRKGHDLVFLDTPGHAAFTLMRARGAQVTDMVILVVAANDGVMPQTVEAIHHAQEAKVPIIVAINKCDLQDSNIERIKQQLSEYHLLSEDWGGSTLFCEISALKNQGVDELLDAIILQAEMMELTANFDTRAEGKVIESRVEPGRGIVSSIIVQRGTLKVGDAYVAGVYYGKVRALFNDQGKKITIAEPSTPVEIIGLTGIPDAGSPFQVTATEKEAKQVSEKRQELDRLRMAKNVKKITLDNLYDTIQDGGVQELKVIVKGDVHGSVEAIKSALEKIGNAEIRINVIHASAGAILESDVNLASASSAIIIGFHVRPTPKAQLLADSEKVEIRKYQIIYDVIEEMTKALEGMLTPDYEEESVGTVEVRETFKVPKIGVIAGCYLTSGSINRNSKVHLIRDGIEIFTGGISSLKRFKDDVKEVKEGYECGIGLADFNDIREGDILEVFAMKEIKKKLESSK